jgi:hypothetical protein
MLLLAVLAYDDLVRHAGEFALSLPRRVQCLFKPLFHPYYHPLNDPDSRFPVSLCNAVQEADPAVLKHLLASTPLSDGELKLDRGEIGV